MCRSSWKSNGNRRKQKIDWIVLGKCWNFLEPNCKDHFTHMQKKKNRNHRSKIEWDKNKIPILSIPHILFLILYIYIRYIYIYIYLVTQLNIWWSVTRSWIYGGEGMPFLKKNLKILKINFPEPFLPKMMYFVVYVPIKSFL